MTEDEKRAAYCIERFLLGDFRPGDIVGHARHMRNAKGKMVIEPARDWTVLALMNSGWVKLQPLESREGDPKAHYVHPRNIVLKIPVPEET